MTTEYTEAAFLDYVKTSRSKNTYAMYVLGLRKFSEWYEKSIDEILKERRADVQSGDLFQSQRFAREVEKFHADLIARNHTISSATTMTGAIKAIFKFYAMPVQIGREATKRVQSTQDVTPRIDQIKAMYRACDNLRDRLIIQLGLNLAWRIGDVLSLRRDELPDLTQDAPIEFQRITQKEGILSRTFLSDETVTLLKEYLDTRKTDANPYLFPSNIGSARALDAVTVNRMLKSIALASGIVIPTEKRIRFHAFRKRFLSECANLRIDVNVAKMLTGKTVEPSMLAYLSDVDLKESFLRISERLRLTEKKAITTAIEPSELEKRLDKLERKLGLIAAMNPEIVRRADERLEQLLSEFPTEKMTMKKRKTPLTLDQKLDLISDLEYAKMIRENGNGDNGNNENGA
ncbi:MAG TPA: tyrosine-type recombinase/integrase [Candidatus Bathyarchaeia archaeon]|nr:tyrosine-type recombinase/integrase [Candidatus Bathyarchaeia archaeon]